MSDLTHEGLNQNKLIIHNTFADSRVCKYLIEAQIRSANKMTHVRQVIHQKVSNGKFVLVFMKLCKLRYRFSLHVNKEEKCQLASTLNSASKFHVRTLK